MSEICEAFVKHKVTNIMGEIRELIYYIKDGCHDDEVNELIKIHNMLDMIRRS